MSAAITLRVTIGRTTETWAINSPTFKKDFIHEPQGETGLGATDNGEDFSGNCRAIGGDSWQSLIKTEGPYSQVYWSVKNYAGTIVASGLSVGDGVERKAIFEHDFPLGDGDPDSTGSNYEITAYVYRWDLSVYWDTYKVWVNDKRGHD